MKKDHPTQSIRSLVLAFIFILPVAFLFFISCKKEYSCENCLLNNSKSKPPVAKAGADQVIILPVDSVLLDGSSSYDPDGMLVQYRWSKVSGPAAGIIVNANSASTKIKSMTTGLYLFALTVKDDSGISAADTVQVMVKDPVIKHPPVANAGIDKTIVLPTDSIVLNAAGSVDPDGMIVSYVWAKVSGPVSFSIANPQYAQTTVTNLVAGTYQFKLTVIDNDNLSSSDTVSVVVTQPATATSCPNRPVIPVQLQQIGTLSMPGIGLASASAGNKIVFAGGIRQTGYSTRADIFDISTNSWTTAELTNPDRQGVVAASVGTKILFAGGGNNDNGIPTARVDIFDVATNTWSTAELSQAREYLAATTVGNKVIFAGGGRWAPFFVGSPVVDIYDNTTNTWSTASLSQGRVYLSATTIGNKAYFAGGLIGGNTNVTSSRIDIYDASTNTWSTAEMGGQRCYHASIAAGGKIFWGGGSTSVGQLPDVEIWDPSTGNSSWTCMIPRGMFNAVAKDDNLIFFTGDQGNPSLPNNKIEIYNTTSHTWSTGLLDQSITVSSIISVNNTIYVAGGTDNIYNGSGPSNKVWKLIF